MGILAPGTSPREGIFDTSANPNYHAGIGAPELADDEEMREKIASSHLIPRYLDFLQHPSLRKFVQDFMGWKREVMLQRTLLRHTVPTLQSTTIHYDQIFLRGGNPKDEFLTAWVPIGDIAINGGGLMYLEDSTQLGRDIEDAFTTKAQSSGLTEAQRISAYNSNMNSNGGLSDDAEEFANAHASGKKWLISPFEAGDVVFHNPYIIHGAAMNEDPTARIRLSTDLRIYEESMEMDKRWFKVFTVDDGL